MLRAKCWFQIEFFATTFRRQAKSVKKSLIYPITSDHISKYQSSGDGDRLTCFKIGPLIKQQQGPSCCIFKECWYWNLFNLHLLTQSQWDVFLNWLFSIKILMKFSWCPIEALKQKIALFFEEEAWPIAELKLMFATYFLLVIGIKLSNALWWANTDFRFSFLLRQIMFFMARCGH